MSVRPSWTFFTDKSNQILQHSGQLIDPRHLASVYTNALLNATNGGCITVDRKKLWVSYPQPIDNVDIPALIQANTQPNQEVLEAV